MVTLEGCRGFPTEDHRGHPPYRHSGGLLEMKMKGLFTQQRWLPDNRKLLTLRATQFIYGPAILVAHPKHSDYDIKHLHYMPHGMSHAQCCRTRSIHLLWMDGRALNLERIQTALICSSPNPFSGMLTKITEQAVGLSFAKF